MCCRFDFRVWSPVFSKSWIWHFLIPSATYHYTVSAVSSLYMILHTIVCIMIWVMWYYQLFLICINLYSNTWSPFPPVTIAEAVSEFTDHQFFKVRTEGTCSDALLNSAEMSTSFGSMQAVQATQMDKLSLGYTWPLVCLGSHQVMVWMVPLFLDVLCRSTVSPHLVRDWWQGLVFKIQRRLETVLSSILKAYL